MIAFEEGSLRISRGWLELSIRHFDEYLITRSNEFRVQIVFLFPFQFLFDR